MDGELERRVFGRLRSSDKFRSQGRWGWVFHCWGVSIQRRILEGTEEWSRDIYLGKQLFRVHRPFHKRAAWRRGQAENRIGAIRWRVEERLLSCFGPCLKNPVQEDSNQIKSQSIDHQHRQPMIRLFINLPYPYLKLINVKCYQSFWRRLGGWKINLLSKLFSNLSRYALPL